MIDALLVGGGGHAMACLDAADSTNLRFVGWVGRPDADSPPLDHLGDDADLPELLGRGIRHAFVAIGDNSRRRAVSAEVSALGFALPALVAGTAHVSRWAVVEDGAAVMHAAHVGPRTTVGAGSIVNTGASVDHDCRLGAFSHVAPGSHLAGGVELGDLVFAGVGVSVTPDTVVGARTVVGAGAVVVADLPPDVVAVGVPARARRDP